MLNIDHVNINIKTGNHYNYKQVRTKGETLCVLLQPIKQKIFISEEP